MKYVMLIMLMLLAACSFQNKPMLENSYVPRLQALTLHGLDALYHGRLASAENSLQRALRSAWLSADMLWVGRAQYHLGALYLVQNKHDLAREKFIQAQRNASTAQDQVTIWRSQFSLALLQQQRHEKVLPTPALEQDMPADVYLTAGRIAHLQGKLAQAKQRYQRVLALDPENPETIYVLSQAYLALALLAREEGQTDEAFALAEQVLSFAKQAGLPMLAAHAKLLQAYLLDDSQKLAHAWQMYVALEDRRGQYDALQALYQHAVGQKDTARQQRWKQALQRLAYKES